MEENFNYPDVFTTSTETKNIILAIIEFNKAVGVIDKDSNNPFFKSQYAALPDILKSIKDPMIASGLTINHFPVGDNRLVTRLSHSSGEFYQAMSYMRAVKDSPQDRGSLISYMMRYNVGAILGLAIDKDDDGNSSTGLSRVPVTGKVELKNMTSAVRDAMLKYIDEGNLDAVSKQLPKYSQNAMKTVITKALEDKRNIMSLTDNEKQ